ncbi:LysE family translocator [Caulobacter sp. KR2-114]|uniref:LysE family translocator n=1 Tax=Caulobacter sp. KR2-114 TaxID=3400912 RepID=UPI003C00363F
MNPAQALGAFSVAAALLTITPGLDTAMVLRTAAVEGPRRAALAAVGVALGCLVWGLAVALGLGVLLTASKTAYTVLKWAGAAYLAWLGIGMLLKPRQSFDFEAAQSPGSACDSWFVRGLMTNLLNPKVGVFYVSFLPQFVPPGVQAAPFIVLLASIHVGLGLAWFAGLITATRPLRRWLSRGPVVRWLDRVTGGVFLAFGARLALDRG